MYLKSGSLSCAILERQGYVPASTGRKILSTVDLEIIPDRNYLSFCLLDHLASAAFLAISRRFSELKPCARACPPFSPPSRPAYFFDILGLRGLIGPGTTINGLGSK